MVPGARLIQTESSRDAGGSFSLFGGRIVGRHPEIVPGERIVQGWRVAYWKPGVYSFVRFDFVDQGPETKILFDHTGFPQGDAENLLQAGKSIVGSHSRNFSLVDDY